MVNDHLTRHSQYVWALLKSKVNARIDRGGEGKDNGDILSSMQSSTSTTFLCKIRAHCAAKLWNRWAAFKGSYKIYITVLYIKQMVSCWIKELKIWGYATASSWARKINDYAGITVLRVARFWTLHFTLVHSLLTKGYSLQRLRNVLTGKWQINYSH